MSNVFVGVALLAILAGIYFIGRTIAALVKKEPFGVFVKRIFIAAAVVIVAAVGSSATQTPEQKAAIEAKREAKAQAQADKQTAELKAAEEKRIAEEKAAEAKRLAEEERHAKAELARQQEQERKRQIEETRAARIADFDNRFAENLGASSIGVPLETRNDAIIYPLDQSGEIYMSESLSSSDLRGIYIHVKAIRQDTVIPALVFYEAAIKAFNPYADTNIIFGHLGLDANLVDDLLNPKSTTINGITYTKKVIGQSLSLGISK